LFVYLLSPFLFPYQPVYMFIHTQNKQLLHIHTLVTFQSHFLHEKKATKNQETYQTGNVHS
jgi:hypothetical protein